MEEELLHLKFSSKKHIPILTVFGAEFYPWEFPDMLATIGLNFFNKKKEVVVTNLFGYRVNLAPIYFRTARNEMNDWKSIYLPCSVKGKTVLDIGAGCGETMAFYFAHGAKKVIGIEPYPRAFEILKQNIAVNHWNAEAINSKFRLEHLTIPHDFLKMDCEGGEIVLFDYKDDKLGPCAIEAHSEEITEKLKSLFQFDRIIIYRSLPILIKEN